VKYQHIYFSYSDRDDNKIEVIKPIHEIRVMHNGEGGAMVSFPHTDYPEDWTTVHPHQDFAYFLMELTGRTVPKSSKAHPESLKELAAQLCAGDPWLEGLQETKPAHPC